MHPTTHQYLAHERTNDLLREAKRARLAAAARDGAGPDALLPRVRLRRIVALLARLAPALRQRPFAARRLSVS